MWCEEQVDSREDIEGDKGVQTDRIRVSEEDSFIGATDTSESKRIHFGAVTSRTWPLSLQQHESGCTKSALGRRRSTIVCEDSPPPQICACGEKKEGKSRTWLFSFTHARKVGKRRGLRKKKVDCPSSVLR